MARQLVTGLNLLIHLKAKPKALTPTIITKTFFTWQEYEMAPYSNYNSHLQKEKEKEKGNSSY